MSTLYKRSIAAAVATLVMGAAHAVTFQENFDGGDGYGPAYGVSGTFDSVDFSVGAAVIDFTGDGVAELGGASYMLLGFTLPNPATSITVSFWGSTLAGDLSTPLLVLDPDGNGIGPNLSGATTAATFIGNPGLNNGSPAGSFYSLTFTGAFVAGSHTVKFDNVPTGAEIRYDDITVTAVPEAHGVALASVALLGLAGLRRRRA